MVMCVSTIVTMNTCQPEKFSKPKLNQFNVASNQAQLGNIMSIFQFGEFTGNFKVLSLI
jgi:hypothetical protein